MGLQSSGYKIDIVFVIDATGSMTPIMDQVRQKALTLHEDITAGLKAANKPVSELRLRVIDFADYASEGEDAIHQTAFFTMPQDKERFEAAINGIVIDRRGGDDPENALEALFIAMNSDWVKISTGEKGRHIIVLLTDAQPLNLQERAGCVGYPADELPENVTQLEEIWNEDEQSKTTSLSKKDSRLVLFVPDGKDEAGHDWKSVMSWERTVVMNVDPSEGLKNITLDHIVAEIVRSC